ncbi:short-subunit dehydrogenase [Micromonospora pisi]|uniref:Short-subunit dehydrogenase n=1 Tax=Micromonospora pisi TaxID=589240 RepID=A0A495JI45_9ACTN|nr:SDR family NAD(P)-dependent oxidoreductase [Micromonospora pisi]RKR88720.1 short-subunit dehydrogenase [Micromonospora pisi]
MVVTGATSGIGLAAATELARRGDEVVLVGRDPVRLAAAIDQVYDASGLRPAGFRADFAVLDDVRRLAGELRAAYDRIDVLANNAGAASLQPVTTVDGFELTMQANHLAPFLLNVLLRDRLDRIVTTASGAHRWGALDPDDLSASLRDYRPARAYGTSKQANILITAEAARRWPAPLAVSYHPGMVRTRFANESSLVAFWMKRAWFMRTPAKGAETLVWLTHLAPEALTNGGYYADRELREPLPRAADPVLAARLWQASERAVGLG